MQLLLLVLGIRVDEKSDSGRIKVARGQQAEGMGSRAPDDHPLTRTQCLLDGRADACVFRRAAFNVGPQTGFSPGIRFNGRGLRPILKDSVSAWTGNFMLLPDCMARFD